MSTPAVPATQISQVLLRLQYQALARDRAPLPALIDTEFQCFSQNGEDGILLYLFSLLGTTNRRVVEICAGNGIECNAANLLVNHGWEGLLFDGSEANVEAGRAFYAACRTTWVAPPTLVCSWITTDNVDGLVAGHGFAGSVDLLSLDLDGNDYWILQALQVLRPRVIVLEFNGGLGPDLSLSIPYDPQFQLDYGRTPYRCGASLEAFTRLCHRRGYRLIGVHSQGFNAFFVREDLATDLLPTRTPADCYRDTPRLHRWSPDTAALLLDVPSAWQEVS